MKKLLLVICLSMAAVMLVTPAFAEELWDFHLRGVDEGLAAGALPPPGFYFINNSYFAPSYKLYNNDGHVNESINGVNGLGPAKLFAYVDVPILLWSTGLKFLGADYGAAIAQPFDYTNLRVQNPLGTTLLSGQQWGTFNTVLVPFILSWQVPCDFRVKAAFSVGFDDGSTSTQDGLASITKFGTDKLLDKHVAVNNTAYAWSSNGYNTFTPNIGISWLHAGWNVSADLFYTWATKNNATNYQSADEFAADYTISYTCGKWTFGLGAAQENQVASDKFNAGDGTGYHSQPGSKVSLFTMGPLLGYNFGPCSVMFMYNWPIAMKNDVGGEWFNFRIVVPLGNPCPLGGK